jgi:hypothetical protein
MPVQPQQHLQPATAYSVQESDNMSPSDLIKQFSTSLCQRFFINNLVTKPYYFLYYNALIKIDEFLNEIKDTSFSSSDHFYFRKNSGMLCGQLDTHPE